MYHNTTNQTGEKLKQYQLFTETQDIKVLDFFKKYKDREITPCEVWKNIFDTYSVPITSVRRSINTLTKDGYLIKTKNKKIGLYGKPAHKWKLKLQA
jgi:hypothetical protein